MSKKLCRVFRHYLDKNSNFKNKVKMTYKVVDDNFEEELLPNDPLYLAFPNNLPDGKTELNIMIKP